MAPLQNTLLPTRSISSESTEFVAQRICCDSLEYSKTRLSERRILWSSSGCFEILICAIQCPAILKNDPMRAFSDKSSGGVDYNVGSPQRPDT